MGKSSPSPPAAPKPAETAAANKDTALWNASLANVNQNTPLGSIKYNQIAGTGMNTDQAGYQAALKAYQDARNGPAPVKTDFQNYNDYQKARQTYQQAQRGKAPDIKNYQTDTGIAPQFQSDITLSPEMQKLFNTTQNSQNSLASTANGLLGRIDENARNPIDYEQFTRIPTSQDLQGLSKQYYDAQMSRLAPEFEHNKDSANAKLLNQGLVPGSEAYNRQMTLLNQQENDARNQAFLSGDQYANNWNNMALTNRSQQINEAQSKQNDPLQQYQALMGQTSVQMPQFGAAPSSNQPGVTPGGNDLWNSYNAQMNQYNQQLASSNNTMNSLFGLGSSLGSAALANPAIFAGFSDRRVKENIEQIGTHENGLPVYSFTYVWDPETQHIGFMADEVEKLHPHAVGEIEGIKVVNYTEAVK